MNKTNHTRNHAEYSRVFHSVSAEAFDKARERMEANPEEFYAELVVLLWDAEDWEACGTDFPEDSVYRDIFDTIQGIAARDIRHRKFNSLSKEEKEAYWAEKAKKAQARLARLARLAK